MTSAISVRRYSPGDHQVWNAFVQKATNATFLHNRDFMEYHADRFTDHSLIFEADTKVLAVLPANESAGQIVSHGGLTYGGLLMSPRLPAATVIDVFSTLQDYLVEREFKALIYKPSPHIFHSQPSEADLYALINVGARQVRTDLGGAIPLQRRQPFSGGRKDGIRKARKAGLAVRESSDFAGFWEMLSHLLGQRHDAVPTHNLDEITLLANRFPNEIRLFAAFDNDTMLAGVLIFDCGLTVHSQYIATTETGRNNGALDFLVDHVLSVEFATRDWFSFGISTTDSGRTLNVGLSRQKEMFGASSVIFSQYQWDMV